jgi:pimeloyl-ACP methyl ester carboxylesterase
VEGVGLPESIADSMEAASLDDVSDPTGRVFRIFADQTRSDFARSPPHPRSEADATRAQVASIRVPVLVAVGTRDVVAVPKNWRRLFLGRGDRYSGSRSHAGGWRQGL